MTPIFDTAGFEAERNGQALNYPVGNFYTESQPAFIVGSYSHYDQIYPHHVIHRAAEPWHFARAALPEITYQHDGKTRSLEDYFTHNPVTSFIVAQGDKILYERYRYARNDRHRFTSMSMAKTVTAMLVGIAVGEGLIDIDKPIKQYEPALGAGAIGDIPVRAALQMASGLDFSEDYGGRDNLGEFRNAQLMGSRVVSRNRLLLAFSQMANPPGKVFNYAGIDTALLGVVLRNVTGRHLSDYLTDRIWQKIGCESDATWQTDVYGHEIAYAGINATARDYARFGRLLAHDGNWNGEQIIPEAWVKEATTLPAEGVPSPQPQQAGKAYGFQTWIVPNRERRMFSLRGIRGQMIYVDPASKLVMEQTSVRQIPVDEQRNAETFELWRALVNALGAGAKI